MPQITARKASFVHRNERHTGTRPGTLAGTATSPHGYARFPAHAALTAALRRTISTCCRSPFPPESAPPFATPVSPLYALPEHQCCEAPDLGSGAGRCARSHAYAPSAGPCDHSDACPCRCLGAQRPTGTRNCVTSGGSIGHSVRGVCGGTQSYGTGCARYVQCVRISRPPTIARAKYGLTYLTGCKF